MKRIATIILLITALTACSKSGGQHEIEFKGTWYVSSVEQRYDRDAKEKNPEYETYDECDGSDYWTFKRGKVTITRYPQSPHEAKDAAYTYDADNRMLTVDGVFKYEVVSQTSSTMTLISHFPPEVWDRETHLTICFVRSKKNL